MSRLDAVTLFVIAACLLAIAFLIYRATDMFGGEDDLSPIDQLREDLTEDDDATYDAEAEAADAAAERRAADERARIIAERRAEAEARAAADAANISSGTINAGGNSDDRLADDGPAGSTRINTGTRDVGSEVRIPSTFDRRPGDYLVLGGTFSYRANAEARAKTLRQSGYDNATMTIFNNGKYAVVLVDRFSSYADAQALKRKMEREGLETAVLRQRDGGRN